MIRDYQKTDYSTLQSFWKQYPEWSDHGVAEFLLPKIGLIYEKSNQVIAAAFLYEAKDTPICWLEWTVADPKISYELRGEALDSIIEALSIKAKSLGYSLIFTSAKNKRLIDRFKTHHFQVGDEGCTEMIRRL